MTDADLVDHVINARSSQGRLIRSCVRALSERARAALARVVAGTATLQDVSTLPRDLVTAAGGSACPTALGRDVDRFLALCPHGTTIASTDRTAGDFASTHPEHQLARFGVPRGGLTRI